jgi:hypothetical protein
MVRTTEDLSDRQENIAGYQHQGGIQPPAGDAHVDYTPEYAELVARKIYQQTFPSDKPYQRFVATSLWRCFSQPPQDWPLALCDGKSVGRQEGTPNRLVVVDKIPGPEAMLGDIPGEETFPAASIFHHNPDHRWWYFSNMHRDEVILLKFHDSDEDSVLRAPHTAFMDPSFPESNPRESIEFRTIAYFC